MNQYRRNAYFIVLGSMAGVLVNLFLGIPVTASIAFSMGTFWVFACCEATRWLSGDKTEESR